MSNIPEGSSADFHRQETKWSQDDYLDSLADELSEEWYKELCITGEIKDLQDSREAEEFHGEACEDGNGWKWDMDLTVSLMKGKGYQDINAVLSDQAAEMVQAYVDLNGSGLGWPKLIVQKLGW